MSVLSIAAAAAFVLLILPGMSGGETPPPAPAGSSGVETPHAHGAASQATFLVQFLTRGAELYASIVSDPELRGVVPWAGAYALGLLIFWCAIHGLTRKKRGVNPPAAPCTGMAEPEPPAAVRTGAAELNPPVSERESASVVGAHEPAWNKAALVRKPFPFHVEIYESEICFLAGLCAQSGGIEIGTVLYCLTTRDGRLVVVFAPGPGPRARRSAVRFEDDIPYVQRASRDIFESWRLELNGYCHSHHRLGLRTPSGDDTNGSLAVSRRNGMHQFLSIIVTFQPPDRPGRSRHIREASPPYSLIEDIRFDAFLYRPMETRDYQRCRLLVIPGKSAPRQVLESDPSHPLRHLLQEVMPVPLSRICYDSAHSLRTPLGTRFAGQIAGVLGTLPAGARGGARVYPLDRGKAVVAIPVSSGQKLILTCLPGGPPQAESAHLEDTASGSLRDVTPELIPGGRCSIGSAYERMLGGASIPTGPQTRRGLPDPLRGYRVSRQDTPGGAPPLSRDAGGRTR